MPTDNDTTDDADADSTDADAAAGTGADGKAEFLAASDPSEYPSTLKLTAAPEADHRRETLDRLGRWEDGEDVPHVVNFENPSDLRALLTDRRVELLRAVMTESPESIRRLAEQVDRDVKTVHSDLQVLADYDVVHFEQDGRAKRPFVPYDSIEVSLEISAPGRSDDAASA